MTALRVIKAAQRLGFMLDEIAELPEAGRYRHGRPVAGLQGRAAAKPAGIKCALPVHVTAGVVGAGAGAVVGRPPSLTVAFAVALAVPAGGSGGRQ